MYLIGGSGHAKVVFEIAKLAGYKVEGFFDDSEESKLFDLPYLGSIVDLNDRFPYVIAIGSNYVRRKIALKYTGVNFCEAIVHPFTNLSNLDVDLGKGTVCMSGVTINPNSRVGEHCIINTSASIDHDCSLEDYVHISPNATLCGNVKIGEGSHIGAGAVVIPGVKIGKWCTIGAGSVVIRDVHDNAKVVGNPARILNF